MRTPVSVLAALLAASQSSCVIVSSTSRPGPVRDAGIGAPRPVRDAQALDAADAAVLSREEATRGLLTDVGEHVILPTYRALAARTASLEAATSAYAASGSDADREAARAAWRDAMDLVLRAEAMQVGPAAMAPDPEMPSGMVGGLGLGDAMYPWPDVVANRCRIDVVTQDETYLDLDALAAAPAFVRGLGAMEYLLFEPSADHGCDPAAAVRVDDAAWEGLGEAGVRARRAAYAHALAVLARRASDALLAAWEPGGGDFADQLARAGQTGSPYPTTQEALNAIFAALFDVDTITKDLRLGAPAARNARCASTISPCPELLESRWAGRSREHLVASLEATREVLLGGPVGVDAIGFDDLLRSIGQGALAADLEATLGDAIETIAALPSLDAASLSEHLADVQAAYDALRLFTSLLKTEFVTVLDLELPMGADGDND